MPDSWDQKEKHALTRAVKFILDDRGSVPEEDLKKICEKASEMGFPDFREVLSSLDNTPLSNDEFDGFFERVGSKKRKFEILRLAIELNEARAGNGVDDELRFVKAVGFPVRY